MPVLSFCIQRKKKNAALKNGQNGLSQNYITVTEIPGRSMTETQTQTNHDGVMVINTEAKLDVNEKRMLADSLQTVAQLSPGSSPKQKGRMK